MRLLLCIIVIFSFLPGIFPQELAISNLEKEAQQYREEGYRLQSYGDLQGALTYYTKAAEMNPVYVEAYNDLGVIYEALGNTEDALKMYMKAIEINPGYLPVYTNLSLLYERLGDPKKAAYYAGKRCQYGTKGELWYEKAKEQLFRLGMYPEARREILEKEAISLSKEIVRKRAQDVTQDIESARRHLDIAAGLFAKDDFSGALSELELAVSLDPQDKKLQVQISDLYFTTKRAYTKQLVRHHMEEAMMAIDNDDYLAAGQKIERALATLSYFSR